MLSYEFFPGQTLIWQFSLNFHNTSNWNYFYQDLSIYVNKISNCSTSKPVDFLNKLASFDILFLEDIQVQQTHRLFLF